LTTANPPLETKSDAASTTHEHPPGLYVLFGAEAWERFSYYGMRALLVLYMVNKLSFSREKALGVYALYTGLVYLTPIAGGFLADKLLGRRKAVLIGGVTMALGQIAMGFPSLLPLALGLLIVGNGFFKPNISTIVGGLYNEGDTRRDSAFTIFYMGINLGAFFSPLICGNLGEKVGWATGFMSAAFGMAAGLIMFVWGQKFLARVGLPPKRAAQATSDDRSGSSVLLGRDYVDVLIWVLGSCLLVMGVVKLGTLAAPAFAAAPFVAKLAVGLALFGVVIAQLYKGSNKEEAQRISVIIILCLFNIFFWMGFEQAGGTMTLFADKQTDRDVGGLGVVLIAVVLAVAAWNNWRTTREQHSGRVLWNGLVVMFGLGAAGAIAFAVWLFAKSTTFVFPASQFQAVNPLLIVVLAPTFSVLWQRLDENPRTKTSTPTKMAIGMIILGLGFIVMFFGSRLAAKGPVSPLWLTAVYTIHTTGELCLSPIGLSMVTKLAPQRVVSLAMGLWFLSSFVANFIAGFLEGWLEPFHLPIYGVLVVSSIVPALLLLVIRPQLKTWMHGRA
jgi:POT family proton-dependent oligopeptide transporter